MLIALQADQLEPTAADIEAVIAACLDIPFILRLDKKIVIIGGAIEREGFRLEPGIEDIEFASQIEVEDRFDSDRPGIIALPCGPVR